MVFDLIDSQRAGGARLDRASLRARRADAGKSRLPRAILDEVRAASLGSQRPPMKEVRRRVARVCGERGMRLPTRATLYNVLARVDGHRYPVSALPARVASALYNVAPDAAVPGPQLAFYCFNYGTLDAVSFAAGLPWLGLYQARRLRGWRPRSRGLLDAVLNARGIR